MASSASPGTAPAVSVVMANRNGAAHLEAAMRSVLRQTLTALELIVIDDASTDESPAIIARVAVDDDRVVALTSPARGGPGAARNLGLARARGQWVSVVDADDLVHPRRLERLVAAAEAQGASVVADDLIHFSTDAPAAAARLFSGARFDRPRALGLSGLLDDDFAGAPNHIGYVKPLALRRALEPIGYREDLMVGEDFDLLLRLAAAGHPLTVLPGAWYLYRRHPASVSHRLDPAHAAAMVRAMKDFAAAAGPFDREVTAALDRRIARMEAGAQEAAVLGHLRARRYAAAAAGLIGKPSSARPVLATTADAARRRFLTPSRSETPCQPLRLRAPGATGAARPASWGDLALKPLSEMTSDDRAALTAATADPTRTVLVEGDPGDDLLGFVPEPGRLVGSGTAVSPPPRVHIRTPTYKRPEMLRRALRGLQAQTVPDWVCDVYDDDPEQSGRAVVEGLADARIRYSANRPRRHASRNLDFCFSRYNPHGARYFFVLEDDNQVLPRFIEDNIALCEREGVGIVLRNQFVEHCSGTPEARLSDWGLLDTKLPEGPCPPDLLHLSVMADMGVSNGGLFWSAEAASDLEIGMPCNATFQEYLRTVAIVEPVYVALEPLAIWAENGADTARDLGDGAGWLRRELDLKRSVQDLQRRVWKDASSEARRAFLANPGFRYPAGKRATGLVKSLCRFRTGGALPRREVLRLALRGAAIRVAGRPARGLDRFVEDRLVSRRRSAAPSPP
ncbi:MAG: glycosyltransferase [Paracoccaceae bacterium]|nr:glycosyltransferase [Paracoccaceae bacterium]